MLGKKGGNQYTKAKKLGLPKPKITDITRKKLSEASKKQIWNAERKKKLSESMKLAVQKYPQSYNSSNRGRTKQIEFDNIKFQGKWELEFYLYCKNNNIKIIKNNKSFDYFWNGNRKYFPDFYLPDIDLYIEVKGYQVDRDLAKWNHFPEKLKIIRKKDIYDIRKCIYKFDHLDTFSKN